MNHHTTAVRRLANANYDLLRTDPHHGSGHDQFSLDTI
jgi:hypothetical protein